MKEKKEIKRNTINLEKVNGSKTKEVSRGFILCGGDDVCSWWDGICNPKYH